MPVVAKVPEEVDLLYGRSYVGPLLFFVPRALWPEKPRGVGAMNSEFIFGRPYSGGIPTGPVGEAYWNFHIPGVAAIFFLYGIFHRWLARFLVRYADVPVAWVLYALTLFYFSPEGPTLTSYLQQIVTAIVFLYWMQALPRLRRAPQYAHA